jgi:hypothetical protein
MSLTLLKYHKTIIILRPATCFDHRRPYLCIFLVRIPICCVLITFLYYDLLYVMFLVCDHLYFAGMSFSCVCVCVRVSGRFFCVLSIVDLFRFQYHHFWSFHTFTIRLALYNLLLYSIQFILLLSTPTVLYKFRIP